MDSLPGPPVPIISQESDARLSFLESDDGQLDPRLIRHCTQFVKHSEVSKIDFQTPVLQFGKKGPKTQDSGQHDLSQDTLWFLIRLSKKLKNHTVLMYYHSLPPMPTPY